MFFQRGIGMSHQHGEMLPVPTGNVSLQRHQVKVEPLDVALARVVLCISHRHHVVLRIETDNVGVHTHGRANKAKDPVT